MWKDWLYFSRGQRVGIIVLITLVLVAVALNFALPLFFTSDDDANDDFISEAIAFQASLQSLDSIRQIERQRQYEERYANQYPRYERRTNRKDESYTLFTFDPNKADSVTFSKLGLRPHIISSIINYRKKGGVFRTNADFSKIYSITSEKFAELEPYIAIEITENTPQNNIIIQKDSVVIFVELNSADTTELMQIRGIGRGYARGIVRFRNETGGFVSVEQLQEIYGMRPENYKRIRPFCTIDTSLVQKIKINTASVDRLNRHPYLNFQQSKAIYDLRRKKGRLETIDELNILKDLPPETLLKMRPYFSFE